MLLCVGSLLISRIDLQCWAVRSLHRLGRRLRPSRTAAHLETGLEGEMEAFFHLRRLGYTIVARRWRIPQMHGDVDLIGWDKGQLCFIEVKSRTKRDLVPAEFQVDEEKKRMLRRMAAAYIRRFRLEQPPIRFDIVSIYLVKGHPPEFELFPDAFG